MKAFLLIPLLTLMARAAGLAASVVTGPEGFVTVNLAAPTGTASTTKLIGVPFHRASVFQGSNLLANPNTLQASTPGWVSGQFTSVPHFARLRSGVASGRFFSVTANTTDTLTLAAGNSTFGVGDSFEIFPAQTLGSLFGTSTPTLQTGSTESAADLVRLNNGTAWITYFHNGTQWRTATDATSQNNTVIQPDQGVFVVKKSAGSLAITLQGAVSVSAESSSIPGTGQGALSSRFLLPTTLTKLGVHLCPGWRAGRSASLADTLLLWNGADWTVFYYTGTSWKMAGGASSQDSTAVPAGEAVVVRRKDGASGSAELTTTGLPFVYSTP